MKTTILTVILALFLGSNAKADAVAQPMDKLLLRTNLIAHVQITSNTFQDFRVRVIEVLHRSKSGIQEGDYLKVINNFYVVCPSAFPIEYAQKKREALAFLSYYKGSWHLTGREIGFFEQGEIRIPFYKEHHYYQGSIADWRADLTDYFEHFSHNDKHELVAKLSESELRGKKFSDLVRLQYHRVYWDIFKKVDLGKNLIPIDIFNPDAESDSPQAAPAEDRIYQFTDQPAIPNDSVQAVMDDILAFMQAKNPKIFQGDIVGITYYSVLFEKDGSVSEVKILKSISPKVDKAIKAYYKEHNQWSVALNDRGEAVRYRQYLPLRIR